MTPAFRARVERAAAAAGLPIGAWIRRAIEAQLERERQAT
jgi:hypothetical protein